ncbi:hypothetical protein CHUAL_007168 [Chamberlinius hualienensis]
MYQQLEEKDTSSSFSLSSKEGQKHLQALNEELKALNEQGSSKLSVVHGTQVEQSQKSSLKRRKVNVNSGRSCSSNRERNGKNAKNSATSFVKRKRLKKRKLIVKSDAETDNEIDSILEEKAGKAKLSTINVKNILKYVVTNDQVLAMIDRKVKSNENYHEETVAFEPKLTRSKIKELLQKEVKLPWPLSPIKNSSSSKTLIELMERSEPDSSSDEEYQPELFPKPCASTENDESAHSTVASDEELQPDTTFVSTDNEESVQSLPSNEPETAQNTDLHSDDILESEETAIALRTRSKLPLNDTPLETIEAEFIAPDITVDMYDEECDDEEWKTFLGEFKKPLDNNNVEVVDDDANDPEYNFLEEEDIPDVEDLRDDRAVRIPKKELHELMAELLESTDDYGDYTETEDVYFQPVLSPNHVTSSAPTRSNVTYKSQSNKIQNGSSVEELFNFERRQLLEEQMRKHVQLLLQMHLLASDSQHHFLHLKEQCALLLNELQRFSEKNLQLYGQSSFLTCNLLGALTIVKTFNVGSLRSRGFQSAVGANKLVLSDRVLSTILNSEVFIYHELLPNRGLKLPSQYKSNFTEAEDNLLALGLEQFMNIKGFSCWALIREHMIPIKTSKQIWNRVKNLKNNCKNPNNPVKCFYQHNRVPIFIHKVEHFSANSVRPLIKGNLKILPEVFQSYLSENRKCMGKSSTKFLPVKPALTLPAQVRTGDRRVKNKHTTVPLLKLHQDKVKHEVIDATVLEVTAEKQYLLKTPEKNLDGKSILHMNMPMLSASPSFRLTPLKQVSPILKKYKPNSLRKTGGNMTNVRKHLPTLMPKYVVVRNNAPRKLAPKVIASLPQPSASVAIAPLPENTVLILDDNGLGINENNSSVNYIKDSEPGNPSDVIHSSSSAATEEIKPAISPVLPTSFAPIEKEIDVVSDVNSSRKNLQTVDYRDSGSEAEIFDDGDDTVDDDAHADNEDDLAALMEASTTIKVIPKQKQQGVIKRKKPKSDRNAIVAMLSCETFEMEMSEEKENAFADAYLQRVKDVVGINNTFEEFLKTLHDFNQSSKNVIELYRNVCRTLRDYPDLCDEFIGFLLPEQAFACGKSMEYINLTRLQIFLKKLEVHFGKNPHHIQKLLKVLSQFQLMENLSVEDLKKAVLPLLRSQQHLIEEFLQLFPEETVAKCRMTDFEEVYIPNVEEEVVPEDKEYETIIHFSEQNDIYGGPDCPCSCHTSDKSKSLNRLRHCFECGIKFIDGRIFLQTGKVLKPCQITCLNSTSALLDRSELVYDASKHNLSTSVISPSSSVSSLSPPIQTDLEDKNQNPVPELKNQKTSPDSLNFAEESRTMQLTSDGTASHQGLSAQNETIDSSAKTKKFMGKSNLLDEVGQNESGNQSENGNKWTRECDRILLHTCQRLKASKETFTVIACKLGGRSAEEVEKRFNYLMSVFSEKGARDEDGCTRTSLTE